MALVNAIFQKNRSEWKPEKFLYRLSEQHTEQKHATIGGKIWAQTQKKFLILAFPFSSHVTLGVSPNLLET